MSLLNDLGFATWRFVISTVDHIAKLENVSYISPYQVNCTSASGAMGGYYGYANIVDIIGSGKRAISLYATNQSGYPVPCSITADGSKIMVASNQSVANIYGCYCDA